MGMSTNVVGIIPADEMYDDMKKIWDLCEELKATIPQEVIDFFDGEKPDGKGVIVDIEKQDYSNEYSSGYEIDLSKIPEHVKIIRFTNSW